MLMKNDWNEGNFSYKLLLNYCNQSVICAFSYMLTSNSLWNQLITTFSCRVMLLDS